MTHVNSPAFKFDLDLVPPVKGALPGFDYEVKFVGQIYIWNDQQVDLLTFTNKAIESGAKLIAANTLSRLVTSEKVSFDPASKKVSFESLMTVNAVGGPPNFVQVGLVADTSDPRPAFRAKFATDKLASRVPPDTLWLAEALQITVDVRPTDPAEGLTSVPAGQFAFAPSPNVPQPSSSSSFAFAPPTRPEITAGGGGGGAGRTDGWWHHS